uniref:Uncharacterized protein n=1 Tax=Eutreptiella gymnastica TaxID=73025 RepID=A0A7S4FQ74_9EUGL
MDKFFHFSSQTKREPPTAVGYSTTAVGYPPTAVGCSSSAVQLCTQILSWLLDGPSFFVSILIQQPPRQESKEHSRKHLSSAVSRKSFAHRVGTAICCILSIR